MTNIDIDRANRLHLADSRRDIIRTELRTHGTVRTSDLAAHLGVSHITVRRDLLALESMGVAVLVHGGARSVGGHDLPKDRQGRAHINTAAKAAIGRSAARMVGAGAAVFLDSGTTCAALTTALIEIPRLTVVTTDLGTAITLATKAPHLSVVICAGAVDPETLSSVGDLTSPSLERFHFDIAFVSASAWSRRAGATTRSVSHAAVKRAALARATTSVLLADAGKYGANEPFVIQDLRAFDAVITDDGLRDEDRRTLREDAVDVHVAGERDTV